ncbi:MAG: cupin domain-containing protein, partial [Planctomycetes bacterium]|nr:cupin domain-containing protein [Planctomycetota bacterium]
MSSWLARTAPRLTFAWRGTWPPGTVESWRRLYDHELVVVQAGEMELTIDDQRLHCPAGTFIIIPPDRPHRTLVTGTVPVVRACLHFDWTCAEDLAPTPLCT